MNEHDKKFREDGLKVRLMKSEKETLRRRILESPVYERNRITLASYLRRSYTTKLSLAVLVILILIGTPITYAAQKSGPGDLLHGFEVYFLEQVEKAVQFSPRARIAYSTDRIQERLEEIQNIPLEELSADDIAETGENVQKQVAEVFKAIPQEKDTKTKVKQWIKVSALLNAHEDALTDVATTSESIEDINDTVAQELDDQVEKYIQEQDAEQITTAINQEIVEIGILIENDLDDPDTVDVSNHLEEAEEQIRNGDLSGALQSIIDAKVQALAQDYEEDEMQ